MHKQEILRQEKALLEGFSSPDRSPNSTGTIPAGGANGPTGATANGNAPSGAHGVSNVQASAGGNIQVTSNETAVPPAAVQGQAQQPAAAPPGPSSQTHARPPEIHPATDAQTAPQVVTTPTNKGLVPQTPPVSPPVARTTLEVHNIIANSPANKNINLVRGEDDGDRVIAARRNMGVHGSNLLPQPQNVHDLRAEFSRKNQSMQEEQVRIIQNFNAEGSGPNAQGGGSGIASNAIAGNAVNMVSTAANFPPATLPGGGLADPNAKQQIPHVDEFLANANVNGSAKPTGAAAATRDNITAVPSSNLDSKSTVGSHPASSPKQGVPPEQNTSNNHRVDADDAGGRAGEDSRGKTRENYITNPNREQSRREDSQANSPARARGNNSSAILSDNSNPSSPYHAITTSEAEVDQSLETFGAFVNPQMAGHLMRNSLKAKAYEKQYEKLAPKWALRIIERI